MKRLVILGLLIAGIMTVISCYHTQNVAKNKNTGKPEWYYKPGMGGGIGGVGISGPHVMGPNAQRELAVTRAIDDISRQMGVEVSNVTKVQTTGTRDSARTQMEVYSIQTVKGETVKARIREFWEDPNTNQLYVWMVVE